jgi:hypothetical protein
MRKNNVKSYNTQPPVLQTMHWTVEIDCGFRSETTIYVTKNEVQYRISISSNFKERTVAIADRISLLKQLIK